MVTRRIMRTNAMPIPYSPIWALLFYAIAILSCSEFSAPSFGGVCAKVRLNLTQDAVMTRTAFRARLELINDDNTIPLENISVQVEVTDQLGADQNDRFQVRVPQLINLSSISGTGSLPPSTSGSASWIIVPNDTAAPNAPVDYWIGGSLGYSQQGKSVTIPLARVRITVHPDAALNIKYFLQRDVYADDPFTEQIIEPSIPFSLAVLVQNKGGGAARNLTLSSAQPTIVDNAKGLQVDFKIVSTEIDGQSQPASSSVNFGTVNPAQVSIARWLLTSSLQGLFTEYKATFQHLDDLGDKRVSLIKSVEIHKMIHLVEAQAPFNDGKHDFLVDDLPDFDDLPDTLYLSDGTSQPVSAVTEGSFDSAPSANRKQIHLTVDVQAGWTYFRIPDPSNGQMTLMRVLRSDGVEIPIDVNAWTTDRTFVGMGRPPIQENRVHLLDYNSTGSYTLEYGVPEPPVSGTPNSAVTALPGTSGIDIPLEWSGEDSGGQGIDHFDIYASTDGGPFQLWLEKSRAPGAVYRGEPGKKYGLYSVATDVVGNREAPPSVPDAETLVAGANNPPTFNSLSDQTLNEGASLDVTATAVDPDAGSVLTYTLGPGAPQGMIINPLNGRVTWTTTESNGGITYPVMVRVTDNGAPAMSALLYFNVIVLELNSSPSLAPIAGRTVAPGQNLAFTAVASDSDLPLQALHYSLDPGAPVAAMIDIATGDFSWTPSIADSGIRTITVRVTDNGSPALSVFQKFQVRVEIPNTAPVINGTPILSAITGQNYSYTFGITDAEGDALTISTPTRPTWLKLVSLGANSFKLEGTPRPVDQGSNPARVVVADGKVSSEQSFAIIVKEARAPVAVPDEYTVLQGQALTIDLPGVLQNDTDADGDPLTAEVKDSPAHGTLDLRSDGSFTYTSESAFTGEDTFSYIAHDPSLASEPATVKITVQPLLNMPQITWAQPNTIIYGKLLSAQQLNAIADVPGSFAYDPPIGTLLNAGLGQVLKTTFTPTDTAQYASASASVHLDVLPASLTITAENKSRYYLQPNPPLTARYDGFVNGETSSVLTTPAALATAATQDSVPGPYPITVSGASAANYTINLVPGELIVSLPPAPAITFSRPSMDYTESSGSAHVDNQAGISFSGAPRFNGWNLKLDLAPAGPTELIDFEIVPGSDPVITFSDSGDILKGPDVIAKITSDPSDFHSLVIEFTDKADLPALQQVLRSLVYENDSKNPDSVPRTITAKLLTTIGLQSDAASLIIHPILVNDAPVAKEDSYVVDENSVLTVTAPGVLDNDFDVEGGSLTAVLVALPGHGSIVLHTDGSFVYTPKAGFAGTDFFSYRVSDGALFSVPATVSIGVNLVIREPVITWNPPASIVYGTSLSDIQLNASANVPGVFTYDPPAGTILAVGNGQTLHALFAPTDPAQYLPAAGSVLIDVLKAGLTVRADNKNRYYLQSNPPLTVSYSPFQNGESPSVLETPALLDTPATADTLPGVYPINVSGATALNYSITFVPGQLSITLPPPPVISFSTEKLSYIEDSGWLHVDEQATVQFLGALLFGGWRLQLDLSGGNASDELDLQPLLGVEPALSFTDSNQIIRENVVVGSLVSDSGDLHRLTIEFASSADLPLIQQTLRSVVYRNTSQNPEPTARTLSAELQPGFVLPVEPSSILIEPQPINDPPLVQNESTTVDANTLSAILAEDLLVNDSDPENDPISIVAVDPFSAQHGSVTLDGAQIFYQPPQNFVGVDSFHYVVADSFGAESIGTLSITVRQANRSPIANPDSAGTLLNKPVSIATAKLLLNDSDPDGDTLSIQSVSSPTALGGTAILQNGSVTYTPPNNFVGNDSFTYVVSDPANAISTGTVTVTVAASFTIAPTSTVKQPDGSVTVRFIGKPRTQYIVQVSDDGISWSFFATQTAAINGAFSISDLAAKNLPPRSYRALVP